MILLGLGAGIAFNPLLLAAMSDVEPNEAGLASGLVNTSFMMGGALGLAILAEAGYDAQAITALHAEGVVLSDLSSIQRNLLMTHHPSQTLASFAAELSFAQIPDPVLRRAEDLMLDWLGSVLAARSARPIRSIQRFAETMGPAEGPSEILTSRRTSSPVFAALVNAAASHDVEQDDVHNGSVFHPAAVVFAPSLATAQH